MLLLVLAYLGGALTILSPCILPVLPFVFSRSDQPFVRSGLPLLAGMAITFAAVASLAAIGGGWATQANQYGRWVALALFEVFGLTLLLPALSERLMRPLVSAGSRLTDLATEKDRGPRIAVSGRDDTRLSAGFRRYDAVGFLANRCSLTDGSAMTGWTW